MPSRLYKDLIFTNHALDRLSDRRVTQESVWKAFRFPDKKLSGKEAGTVELQRREGDRTITVIAKQNERGQWLVLSCWMDPPIAGTQDDKQRRYWHQYQRAPWWMKWLLTFKKQIGL